MLIFFGILLFLFLVIAHEYGHFLVAKRNGVEVEEFGIGFPPKLFGKTIGKGIFRSYYTINLLPLGGFVRLKGESSADKRKGSFGAASLWVKTKITLAGVVVNALLAVIIFTVVGLINVPVIIPDQFAIASDTHVIRDDVVVAQVEPNSPAEKAGLKVDDVILKVNDQIIENAKDLPLVLSDKVGQVVTIEYKNKKGISKETKAHLNAKKSDAGLLGVAPRDVVEHRYTWSAPIFGLVFTAQLFWFTLVGLAGMIGSLFAGDAATASQSVGGPVLIVYIMSQMESLSLVAFLVGTISVALSVFNALPLPALDGGRIALTAFYALIKRPLSERVENWVHGTGFILLMGLALLITFLDISRI